MSLSLIAFIGGGLVALLLLRCVFPNCAALTARWAPMQFQGTPLLMQLFLAYRD